MKTENDRSQDSKKEKPATRLVKMKLPLELVDAIEVMAEDGDTGLHNMILKSLKWAAWSHSHGRGPDVDMFADMLPGTANQPGQRGYAKWDERLRAKREIRALNQLYGATGLPSEENAFSQPRVAVRECLEGG
jgi:hypothetical protein